MRFKLTDDELARARQIRLNDECGIEEAKRKVFKARLLDKLSGAGPDLANILYDLVEAIL